MNTDRDNQTADTLTTLLDALPAGLYAQALALCGPRWDHEEEDSHTAAFNGEQAAQSLSLFIKRLNDGAQGWEPWPILDAVKGLDVEAVTALLGAGLGTDHLYGDEQAGGPASIATLAFAAFSMRVELFGPQAPALQVWAQRCADIVEATVKAGGPAFVSVGLTRDLLPVTSILQERGIRLQGLESWREIGAALMVGEDTDSEEVLMRVLDHAGVWPLDLRPGFQNAAREARLQAALRGLEAMDAHAL